MSEMSPDEQTSELHISRFWGAVQVIKPLLLITMAKNTTKILEHVVKFIYILIFV